MKRITSILLPRGACDSLLAATRPPAVEQFETRIRAGGFAAKMGFRFLHEENDRQTSAFNLGSLGFLVGLGRPFETA